MSKLLLVHAIFRFMLKGRQHHLTPFISKLQILLTVAFGNKQLPALPATYLANAIETSFMK